VALFVHRDDEDLTYEGIPVAVNKNRVSNGYGTNGSRAMIADMETEEHHAGYLEMLGDEPPAAPHGVGRILSLLRREPPSPYSAEAIAERWGQRHRHEIEPAITRE